MYLAKKTVWKRKLSESNPAGEAPKVDVGSLFPNSDVKLAVQPPESEGDAKVRRFKEVVGFLLAVLIVLASLAIAIYLLFFQIGVDAAEKKWALGTISTVLGAVRLVVIWWVAKVFERDDHCIASPKIVLFRNRCLI